MRSRRFAHPDISPNPALPVMPLRSWPAGLPTGGRHRHKRPLNVGELIHSRPIEKGLRNLFPWGYLIHLDFSGLQRHTMEERKERDDQQEKNSGMIGIFSDFSKKLLL